MQTKMVLGFEIGTKVVPKSKSVWCRLEESIAWQQAQRAKQPYLYVRGETIPASLNSPCLLLAPTIDAANQGDFFLPSDVEIYKEEETDANVIC